MHHEGAPLPHITPHCPHSSSPTPSPSSTMRVGMQAPRIMAQPSLQWPTKRQTGQGGL